MVKDKPLVAISKEREKEIKEKWVYNLTTRTLNEAQLSVLQRGLAFNPSKQNANSIEFVATIESAARLIGPETAEAASLRSSCIRLLRQHQPARQNITKEEWQAIKEFEDDASIIILPADKGRATTYMLREDYDRKMKALFDDETTYTRLA